MKELNHNHCQNFCPIDVAKGICRLKGEIIMADTPVCENFSEKPRCGLCYHYCDATAPAMCFGLAKIYWIDANINASQCEAFSRY